MDDKQKQIKNIIINGQKDVFEKRQLEIAPKIRKLLEDYMKIILENKEIFDEYHNSFYKNESDGLLSDIINYFSNGMNELELNEFDLDLIIDDEINMTLLDFILKYKPDLSNNNFSLGGSYNKIGIKFLEKILISGDREYIKYLSEIGFTGSPELYLTEINGKKVIDYLIEGYEQYREFCGKEFNLKVKDNDTKEYILKNVQNGKYDIINEKGINVDRLFMILDLIDYSTEDLLKQIAINGIQTNIIELYLTQDILKGKEKLINVIASDNVVRCLIKKLIETDNKQLKSEIIDCLNNIYIDEITLENLDSDALKKHPEYGVTLKLKKEEAYKDEDELFYEKINELNTLLKEGTPTSEELINYVINNYINLYKSGIPFALKELETLILIKRNNSKFHIEDSSVGPNFDNDTIHLVLTDKSALGYHGEDNYATFNHEMTHAIQYYCYNDNTPRDYYHTLPDKNTLADSISKYCVEIMGKMKKVMSSEEFKKSNSNSDNLEEIRQRQIYYISTNMFGYEREVVDIFDTILCFTENLSKLGIENADFIEGHPYDYMKYGGYDFSEMLADYKSVMSSGREDLINFVKSNLPVECTSFIENFYMDILTNYISIYTNNYHNYKVSKNR